MLDVAAYLLVGKDPLDEGVPERTFGVGLVVDGGLFGEEVFAAVGACGFGGEVVGAVVEVEEERVGVEVVWLDRDASL